MTKAFDNLANLATLDSTRLSRLTPKLRRFEFLAAYDIEVLAPQIETGGIFMELLH